MITKIPKRQKGKEKYGFSTVYAHFRSQTGGPKCFIAETRFNRIQRRVLETLRDALLEGHHVMLPGKLGSLEMVTRDIDTSSTYEDGSPRGMKIDFNETWKLWNMLYPNKTRQEILEVPNKKKVYHTNDHSGNTYNRLMWHKVMPSNMVKLYKMNTARKFKTRIAKVSKEGKTYNREKITSVRVKKQ